MVRYNVTFAARNVPPRCIAARTVRELEQRIAEHALKSVNTGRTTGLERLADAQVRLGEHGSGEGDLYIGGRFAGALHIAPALAVAA